MFHVTEMPAVSKLHLSLKSRFSIDYVLHEFQNIVVNVSQQTTTKVFKLLPEDEVDTGPTIGVIYNPLRAPLEVKRYSKTCVKWPPKIRQNKILMTNVSLMKVKNFAECSPWSIVQNF